MILAALHHWLFNRRAMTKKTPSTIVEDPFIASNPHIDEARAKIILEKLSWQRDEGADTPTASAREWGCLEVRKNADIANALDKLGIDWSYTKDIENYSTFIVSGLENLAKLKQSGATLTGHDLAHIETSTEPAR